MSDRPRHRIAAVTLVASLVLGSAACDAAAELGEVRVELDRAAESASEALADLEDRISEEVRPFFEDVRSRVGGIGSDVEAAADLTGDRAREAYEDLERRASELRADVESRSDEIEGEAREAWERLRSALEDLESRIERALNDLR